METSENFCRYQVTVRGIDGSKTFKFFDDDFDSEYERKIVSALKKLGCYLNGILLDGCDQPDGCDGYFGKFLSRKVGGGFSPNGRFSIRKI